LNAIFYIYLAAEKYLKIEIVEVVSTCSKAPKNRLVAKFLLTILREI
jgi:hypothetical protein